LNKDFGIDESFPRSAKAPEQAIVGGEEGFWPFPQPHRAQVTQPVGMMQKSEPSPDYNVDEKFNRPAKPPTEAEVGGN